MPAKMVKAKGKVYKWNGRFRKPLSQRILESECRRCVQKGHWKAECPLNRSANSSGPGSNRESSAFAGTATAAMSSLPQDDMILVNEVDEVEGFQNEGCLTFHDCFVGIRIDNKGQRLQSQLSDSVLSRLSVP